MHRCHFLILASSIALLTSAFSEPVRVVPPDFQGAEQPQVAVAPNGTVYIVFGVKSRGDIYCTHSIDGAKSFSAPQRIDGLDKLALGLRRGPRIAATDTAVVVTAISHGAKNLYSWRSVDGGKSWSGKLAVNDTAESAGEGLHDMAGDGRGKVFVNWLDHRNKQTELWGAVSVNGGESWSPNVRIYHSPDGHICECCSPSAAVTPEGELVAMWRNWLGGARDLYLATSRDDGKTFTTAAKMGSGTWLLQGCPMDGGGIAIDADGKPWTVWRRNSSIFMAKDSSDEIRVSSQGTQPVAVLGREGMSLLWQNGGKLYRSAVARVGSEPEIVAESAGFAAVAANPNRTMAIVAWEGAIGGNRTIFSEILK